MKKIVFALAIISTCFASAQNVGDDAPNFTVNLEGGGSFSLSDQQDKVVFLFFFGFNCPHCISNGPNTQDLYEVFENDPDFVAIGLDTWDGNSSGVSSYRSRTGITYDLGLQGSRVGSDYSTTYDRIILIDKNGVIRYKGVAQATSSETRAVQSVINQLLAENTDDDDDDDDDDNNTGGTVLSLDETKSVSVYPNPAFDYLIVDGLENRTEASIYDMSGQLISSSSLTPSANVISLDNFSTGIYHLILSNESRSETIRFAVD